MADDSLGAAPSPTLLHRLAGDAPLLAIDRLEAGYGRMPVVHDLSLAIGAGQCLCLIGPNGAGKSTVLQAIFGFADLFRGDIRLAGRPIDRLSPADKLRVAGIAYVLQHGSVFPDLTVAENLILGGYLKPSKADAVAAAEAIAERHPRLAARWRQRAGVLSGGERRLLEITRALVMDPVVLLVDEPSIGLEPRAIELVFEILERLRREEQRTLIMVEQNARKGLAFADIGYVLVAGEVVMADQADVLLADPRVGRLFLGG